MRNRECNFERNKLCKLDCDFCYQKSFAPDPRALNWSETNGKQPRDVFRGTKTKYEFVCDNKICGHSFSASLNNIRTGYWCPYCCFGAKKLCDNKKCQYCFKRSFASSPKAPFWSERNIKTPREVPLNSNTKYEFLCPKKTCGHVFMISLVHISNQARFCMYCAGRKLCENEECNMCYQKSFASHPRAKFWSEENIKTPREVFRNTKKRYKFDCECGHVFNGMLRMICKTNAWCSYCASKTLCADENCIKCWEKSFASSPYSELWSEDNDETPRNVFLSSEIKYLFFCNRCKKNYMSYPNNIKYGRGCPSCKNKTEHKLKIWLEKRFDDVIHQAKFDWCRNIKSGRFLPFDFVINKVIVELDGKQHFEQVSNWAKPEDTRLRDRYKERRALNNGYSVIRLLTDDVYKNKRYNSDDTWETVLLRTIKRLLSVKEPTITEIYNGTEKDVFYKCELVFGE